MAVKGYTSNGKAIYSLCGVKIAMSGNSSSNMLVHYRKWHRAVAGKIERASSITKKSTVILHAVKSALLSEGAMSSFVSSAIPNRADVHISDHIRRRVAGILLAASKQLPMEVLGSPELEASVYCCGRSSEKSKKQYYSLVSDVYNIVAKHVAAQTDAVTVGSFTYDSWSSKQGAAIAGMTFNYMDSNWKLRTFPVCFLDIQGMGKSADEHEAIISASLSSNDKIGKSVLVFSGTSDNEPSVVLGMDQYFNYSGSVRCIYHTLALAVNDAIETESFIKSALQRIISITRYMNRHKTVGARLLQMQCRDFTHDRIVTLDKDFITLWHSKLNILEKYTILRPYLSKVLPDDAPDVLSEADDECITECILVLREVRRVTRALEADRRVSASRMPRVLRELYDMLSILAADCNFRGYVPQSVRVMRLSEADDDKAALKARKIQLRYEDTRKLASALRDAIHSRLHHFYEQVFRTYALATLTEASEERRKARRKSKQAVLAHCASLFDVNECTMDWVPDRAAKQRYVSVLADVIIMKMGNLCDGEINASAQFKANFVSMHEQMVEHLEKHGRKEINAALTWWHAIENSSILQLRKQKLYFAPLFTEAALGYLSIQASSASTERLFGEAGLQKGTRHQHTDSTLTEMLLIIRSYVRTRMQDCSAQNGFLSRRAQCVKELSEDIAREIEAACGTYASD